MSTDPQGAPHPLPDRPNLRHLKAQAKDVFKAGAAKSITDAQFQVARSYGFASWPKLKAHLESLEEAGPLKQLIERNDTERVAKRPFSTRSHSSAIGGYRWRSCWWSVAPTSGCV
jgi:hypothetical protein